MGGGDEGAWYREVRQKVSGTCAEDSPFGEGVHGMDFVLNGVAEMAGLLVRCIG
jgi:hypothetical protein